MSVEREALRQQMLLRALRGDAGSAVLQGWLRNDTAAGRGLAAYRANAGAAAERALAAAFPTVRQLVGEESFAALARAHWHAAPPQEGDLARFGAALPDFIADSDSLAEEPYLADVARLDWAVHEAERAADAPAAPQGLARLADGDPLRLALRLRPGTALVDSMHPVATIWLAHRSDAADRFDAVRAAFAAGGGEHALVLRRGWRAGVERLSEADAGFTRAVLDDVPLAAALHRAGAGFEFEPWLLRALRDGWLVGVAALNEETTT